MIRGKWFITPSAVRKFQELSGMRSFAFARETLIRMSADSHFVRRLDTGSKLFRLPHPHRWRFVVRDSEAGLQPALVDVLPEFGGAVKEGPRG